MPRSWPARPSRKSPAGPSRRQVLKDVAAGAVGVGLGALGGSAAAATGPTGTPAVSAAPAAQPIGERTDATGAANAAVLQQFPFADTSDFELAARGLIEATR